MAKLSGAWATAQLSIALVTLGWAVLIFLYPGPEGPPTEAYPREAFWPAATAVAGLFFLVAFWLFARSHPDGRIVAVFGLAIFVIANGMLVLDRAGATAECPAATGVHSCNPFAGERLWGLVGGLALVTAAEGTLLLTMTAFLNREKRRASEDEMATLEAGWH